MTAITKDEINIALEEALSTRLAELQSEIERCKESRNNESKSSMGDKYETGRAMVQSELDRLEQQLNILEGHIQYFSSVKNTTTSTVMPGSVVRTQNGIYYFSIPFGKLAVGNDLVFVLSLASPLGKELEGKKVGDQVIYGDRKFEVLAVG